MPSQSTIRQMAQFESSRCSPPRKLRRGLSPAQGVPLRTSRTIGDGVGDRRRRGRSARASLSGASPTADRGAGWHELALVGNISEGPHHRSPRPEPISDPGPKRAGTLAGGTDHGVAARGLGRLVWSRRCLSRFGSRNTSRWAGRSKTCAPVPRPGSQWLSFFRAGGGDRAVREEP
jgi:hypothetical protein